MRTFHRQLASSVVSAVLCSALAVRSVHAQGAATPPVAPQQPAPAATTSEKTRADELFRSGKEQLDKQSYAQACPMFAESYQLDPATGTLLALALCHERAGQFEDAHREYLEAAERARHDGRADREQAARERAAVLEPRLPKHEAAPVAAPAVAEPSRAPARAAPTQARSSGLTAGEWAGLATLGASVISLGIATGLVVHAVNKNDASKSGCDGDLCTAPARQDRLDARSAGDTASVMFLVSGALATTGVAIYFSSASSHSSSDYALTPWTAPHAAGATVRGSF